MRILTKCSPGFALARISLTLGRRPGAQWVHTQVKSCLPGKKALNGIEPSKTAA